MNDEDRPKQKPLFDLGTGRELRNEGRDLAAGNREVILRIAQGIAFKIAESRISRTCDADDVFKELIARGYPPAALGRGAGKLFDPKFWKPVAQKQSTRVSNHARPITVWRLK